LVWNIAAAALGGRDVWAVLKAPAVPFLKVASEPGFALGAVAVGVVVHYALSIIWATLYAAFVLAWPRRWVAQAGVIAGVIAWAWMQFVMLPASGAGMVARDAPAISSLAGHVIFGATLAIAYFILEARTDEARRGRHGIHEAR
jgi:uncharacterized membrane protein YagU involved in acid resistance